MFLLSRSPNQPAVRHDEALRDLRSEVAFDLEKSVWDWGFRRKRWDRSTSLIHLRTCITSVLVLLYAGLGLRDGFGPYMEHWLGVEAGYPEEWVSDASRSPQEARRAVLSLSESLGSQESDRPSVSLLWTLTSSGGSWSAREGDWLAHLFFSSCCFLSMKSVTLFNVCRLTPALHWRIGSPRPSRHRLALDCSDLQGSPNSLVSGTTKRLRTGMVRRFLRAGRRGSCGIPRSKVGSPTFIGSRDSAVTSVLVLLYGALGRRDREEGLR